MIFDLRGKRRRTVQATYLGLAILMGAGLVFFGIGSSVSGGLSDLFGGGSGDANSATKSVKKKIAADEKKLEANPNDSAALADLVRSHYQLASTTADTSGTFSSSGLDDLQQAADTWKRYLSVTKKPDKDLANTAIQVYTALAQAKTDPKDQTPYWEGASGAAEVLTENSKNPAAFVRLVQFATLAGQTRKADLAGQRAIELAPKGQEKQVKAAVQQAKGAAAQQGQQSATPSG